NIPFKTPKINHVKSNIKKYELDLHVEKLTPLLSSNEILLEQLKLAEQFIDNALVLNLSEVVLIHGIGDGVLKKALHGFLKNHAMVIRFHNNYSPKYGYGATFVTL
ncbi:MAG: Smr/MutS family protein, partial [Sediminibacterium sp.]|nr:Smr/MutS family protein [Sediminibacterium sp.]